MRNIIAVLLITVLASGCNPFSAIWGAVKPSGGVDVDAELTVGDKNEEVNTDVAGEKTVNTAENITYNVHEENKGPSVWWVAFAFSGWLLWFVKSPQEIWRRLREVKRK